MVFGKWDFLWIILLVWVLDVHTQHLGYLNCLNSSWENIRANKSQLQIVFQEVARKRIKSGCPEIYSLHLFVTYKKDLISGEGICNGEKLRVGILTFPQIAYHDVNRNVYSGFSVDLLEEISQRLNFTYSLIEPEDRQWGAYKNGTWNGLVGKLVTNEYDLVVAPLTRQKDREKVIDMVCPTTKEQYKLWILNPEKRSDKNFLVFNLMDTEVWLLYITGYFFVVGVYSVMGPSLVGERSYLRKLVLHLEHNWIMFYRALVQQGSDELPQSVSRRTVLVFWWWFSILVSITYSGTIVATLSDNKFSYPFNSVREMQKQNVYKYGIVGNSVVETILQESKSSYLRQLLKSIRRFAETDPVFMSEDFGEHLRKMREEKYAFIGYIPNSTGKYVPINEPLVEEWCCLGLPKHSPLKRPLKRILKDLWQYGIMQALWRKYGILQDQPKHQVEIKDSKRIGISLYRLKSAFEILTFGVFMSGMTLILEVLIYIYCNYCKHKLKLNL